jgi:phosphoglycolate phosphatase-like HAD superfamily hydrolase
VIEAMAETAPTLLALDFDGVLCDGLVEYFQVSWQAYCQIWSPADPTPPAGLAEQFYRLRPVVETGWEMPLVLRSLLLGVSEAEILQGWADIAARQIATDGLASVDLSTAVDHLRDQWIKTDLKGWLAQHRFYPGVVDRLRQVIDSPVYLVIISTKEGRFIRQLLQQQAIELSTEQILGKETGQPKAESLRQLIQKFSTTSDLPVSVWFVEDRLKTLLAVQPKLARVKLFLADWGYNTATERESICHSSTVQLLSLKQFSQDFSAWL